MKPFPPQPTCRYSWSFPSVPFTAQFSGFLDLTPHVHYLFQKRFCSAVNFMNFDAFTILVTGYTLLERKAIDSQPSKTQMDNKSAPFLFTLFESSRIDMVAPAFPSLRPLCSADVHFSLILQTIKFHLRSLLIVKRLFSFFLLHK